MLSLGPGACICNQRCLAKRRSSAASAECISPDWKKSSTCDASEQFFCPIPKLVLDALIWKIIAMEPRKSFCSPFLILQASGARVVS